MAGIEAALWLERPMSGAVPRVSERGAGGTRCDHTPLLGVCCRGFFTGGAESLHLYRCLIRVSWVRRGHRIVVGDLWYAAIAGLACQLTARGGEDNMVIVYLPPR